jgi:hypothetical protein
MNTHAVLTAHTGFPAAAAATLFGGLGYLPLYPEDWLDAAELTLGDEAACLSAADLYVLSPDMCDVVVAAA